MTAALVSVILPTYNRANTLRRAIDSVLTQTYRELELIVIDDGSTDETEALLSSYSDPRLKLLKPGRLGCAAKARNHGLKSARGEFVAFQDSDDVWMTDKLERQIAFAAQHPDAAFTTCGYILIHVDGRRPRYYGAELLDKNRDVRSLFSGYGCQISTPTWLVRRERLVEVGGFDESFAMWEDWELSIRLEAGSSPVQSLNEPLVVSFVSKGSVNNNAAMRSPTLEAVMKKHPQWVSSSRRVRANHARICIIYEIEAVRPRRAWHYVWQALRYDPLYWKTWATIARRLPQLLAFNGS